MEIGSSEGTSTSSSSLTSSWTNVKDALTFKVEYRVLGEV
jgi:hypothetical protein